LSSTIHPAAGLSAGTTAGSWKFWDAWEVGQNIPKPKDSPVIWDVYVVAAIPYASIKRISIILRQHRNEFEDGINSKVMKE
jgi:hypothetical protein